MKETTAYQHRELVFIPQSAQTVTEVMPSGVSKKGLFSNPSWSFCITINNLGFQLDSNDIDLAPLAMGGLTYGVTTMEMAAAYGAFANRGVYIQPRMVLLMG